MAQMTVVYAIELDGELTACAQMLRGAAEIATRAEASWAANGDGSVPTLWTATQKAAFGDIIMRTEQVRGALRARLVEAA